MVIELRCDNGIKFGELDTEEGTVEVKCRSRYCGAGSETVVLHKFDVDSGKLLGTERFREPRATGKDG